MAGLTRSFTIGPLAAISCASLGMGQELYHEFIGRGHTGLLSVAPAGDVDGDLIPEYVVGGLGGGPFGGLVALVNGATGAVIHGIAGPGDYYFGQVVEGVGDFDGDQVPDFASGIPDDGPGSFDGEVRVWSGATGEELALISGSLHTDRFFGEVVESLGDLDGDGFADFAAAWGGDPDIWILGGPDGRLIRRHYFGAHASVACIGDVDGDSVADYAAGTPGLDIGGGVHVCSGKTGDVLYFIPSPFEFGFGFNPAFGEGIVGMGDLDGDGFSDFAVSATFRYDCQGTRQGWIRFYSGKDGALLFQRSSTKANDEWVDGGCTYRWLEGGEDVNGDGVLDYMTRGRNTHNYWNWTGQSVAHHVAVHSGRTGTMLWRKFPGWGGEFLGDVDGDGISEWMHGDHTYDRPVPTENGGRITVYRGAAGDAEHVCTGALPNSTGESARLLLDGPISVGNNDLSLSIEDGVPGELAVFFYGPDLISQPFGDGILCVGGGALGVLRIGAPIALDGNGYGSMPVDMSEYPLAHGATAWQAGGTWVLQAWYRDPAGLRGYNLTDAYQVTFLP